MTRLLNCRWSERDVLFLLINLLKLALGSNHRIGVGSSGEFYWGDEDADDAGLPGLRFPRHGRPRSPRDRSQRDPKPPRPRGLWGGVLGGRGHAMHGIETPVGEAAARSRRGAAGDGADSGRPRTPSPSGSAVLLG